MTLKVKSFSIAVERDLNNIDWNPQLGDNKDPAWHSALGGRLGELNQQMLVAVTQ